MDKTFSRAQGPKPGRSQRGKATGFLDHEDLGADPANSGRGYGLDPGELRLTLPEVEY